MSNKKWYQKTTGIIVFLIIFFPVGLYLMWKYAGWNKKIKGGISALFALATLTAILTPAPDVESISLSIPDYQNEYDILTEIPVVISVSPENADLSSLKCISAGDSLTFSDSKVLTGSEEGTYDIYVEVGNVKSNAVSITVIDKAERQRIANEQAAKEAEEKRIAAEQAAKEAEEKRIAAEQAAKEAEEKRIAEEAAAKEAEEKRIAAEQTAKEAEANQNITENSEPSNSNTETASEVPSSSYEAPVTNNISTMVWIPRTGKKYHRNSSCSNMKNPTQVTLEDAQARGYEPCKKCY